MLAKFASCRMTVGVAATCGDRGVEGTPAVQTYSRAQTSAIVVDLMSRGCSKALTAIADGSGCRARGLGSRWVMQTRYSVNNSWPDFNATAAAGWADRCSWEGRSGESHRHGVQCITRCVILVLVSLFVGRCLPPCLTGATGPAPKSRGPPSSPSTRANRSPQRLKEKNTPRRGTPGTLRRKYVTQPSSLSERFAL
jgi:hypothetical protein